MRPFRTSPARRRAPVPAVAVALGVAALLALASCGNAARSGAVASVSPTPTSEFRGAMYPHPHPRPHFVLTDQQGQRYDFGARTAGTVTFLYFGYTHCPDVCPTTMADLATALRSLPGPLRDTVQVVFVTTDPKRDTPKAIGAWLAHFDPDLHTKFVGLTGGQAEIDGAQRAAGVPLAEDDGQTHSAQLLLYGPDDVSRVFYLQGASPRDIAHDIPLIAKG
ncbi:MAG: SCO family protein [Actinobacteria bacterium]|nr:SCO family protein [Actinomycetota bacterium]MBI3686105.1 SCO family protein [Actinomycetota bacterium]